jgi:hypothetical protein
MGKAVWNNKQGSYARQCISGTRSVAYHCPAYYEGIIMKEDVQLSIDSVRAHVEASKRLFASISMGNGPQAAFLPAGDHHIRFFPDSAGELLRDIGIHRHGKIKTHCPTYLGECDPAADYPDCEICHLAARRDDWRLRMQPLTMTYGYVHATQHPDKHWQPGRVYVIIGNTRMRRAFRAMLESMLASDPETLSRMLTPEVAGPTLLVKVQGGQKGYVTMDPCTSDQVPPVALGNWYKPLSRCWITRGFDLFHYTALLCEVTAEANQ